MKKTLDIQDNLLATVKVAAVMQRTTLTRLIEEGLSMRLAAFEKKLSSQKINLPVMKGTGGIKLGIDPMSNHSMLDALDK